MSGNFRFVLIIPLASRGSPLSMGSGLPGLISQRSSMLMYDQPCWLPAGVHGVCRAAHRWSSTASAKQFQLFHPSGGGERDRWTDHDGECPRGLAVGISRGDDDAICTGVLALPVITPDCGSSINPRGSPVACTVSGRSPLTGTRYRKGCPGRAPTFRGPLIRGVGEGFGVRIVWVRSTSLKTRYASRISARSEGRCAMRAFMPSA
jgi:hypothetical protein